MMSVRDHIPGKQRSTVPVRSRIRLSAGARLIPVGLSLYGCGGGQHEPPLFPPVALQRRLAHRAKMLFFDTNRRLYLLR